MIWLKNLVFTLFVPGTVVYLFPNALGFIGPIPAWSIIGWLGISVIALGVVIYARCVWDFATVGRGTPAPIDAPKVHVATGLYRYSRNPMYVGVLATLVGESLLFWSTTLGVYAAYVALTFHLFIVLYEEPTLRRTFGASYDSYCETVPRWVPRLR